MIQPMVSALFQQIQLQLLLWSKVKCILQQFLSILQILKNTTENLFSHEAQEKSPSLMETSLVKPQKVLSHPQTLKELSISYPK